MGKNRGAGPRRRDVEKLLRADNGRMYSVSTILVCEKTGERSCRGLIHRGGWVTFSGRSFDKMPLTKFNHCTSKFFAPRPEGAEEAPAEVPVLHKRRRGTWVEQPVAPEATAVTEQATEPAAAPAVEQPAEAGVEETMAKQGADRSRRFTNSAHGKRLLTAVREFKANTEWRRQDQLGFWVAFAKWVVASRPDLSAWKANGHTWARRFRVAHYYFSSVGIAHAAQVARVEKLRREYGLKDPDVWEVIGGPKATAAEQLGALRPWGDGALGRLAAFFDVSEEFLRHGTEPMPEDPPAPKPSEQLPLPTVTPAGEATGERFTVRFPSGASVTEADVAELSRLRHLMAQLERLAAHGKGICNKQLRFVVEYMRGEDPLEAWVAGVMAADEE